METRSRKLNCMGGITGLVTTGASTVICHKFNVQIHNYCVYLSTLDLDYRFVFITANMFVFISATCSNPLYVFQIKDPSVNAVNGSRFLCVILDF